MGSAALRGRPVVIAPLGAPRAVVYDMNEPAFREGIRKRMPLSQVLSRYRGVRVLPPRFNRYANAMKEIARLGLAVTPAVESGMGDGHLFLDITGTTRLYGPGPDVAFRLKKTIKRQMGLDSVWSLATNKLVAKAATRLVKPLGEYIVGPGEVADFLAPFPLKLLPGISRREARTAAASISKRVSPAATDSGPAGHSLCGQGVYHSSNYSGDRCQSCGVSASAQNHGRRTGNRIWSLIMNLPRIPMIRMNSKPALPC